MATRNNSDVAARLRRGDAQLVADRVVDRSAARLDRARQVQLLDVDRRPLDLAERLLGALLEALPGAVRLVRREVGRRLGRLREHEHRVLSERELALGEVGRRRAVLLVLGHHLLGRFARRRCRWAWTPCACVGSSPPGSPRAGAAPAGRSTCRWPWPRPRRPAGDLEAGAEPAENREQRNDRDRPSTARAVMHGGIVARNARPATHHRLMHPTTRSVYGRTQRRPCTDRSADRTCLLRPDARPRRRRRSARPRRSRRRPGERSRTCATLVTEMACGARHLADRGPAPHRRHARRRSRGGGVRSITGLTRQVDRLERPASRAGVAVPSPYGPPGTKRRAP